VHIDSSKRSIAQPVHDFTVSVPHGLNNVSRVALKSITIPNTVHNIYGDYTHARWIEYYWNGTQWLTKDYMVNLPEGYLLTSDTMAFIQSQMEAFQMYDSEVLSNHQFEAESPLIVTFNQNDSIYINSLAFDSGNNIKLFALSAVTSSHSVWEMLGFEKNKMLNQTTANIVLDYLRTHFTSVELADSPSTKLRDDTTLNKYLIRCCKDDLPIADRTLTALHSGTRENLPGLFICSDKLGSDSFESVAHGTENVATPSNVIQYIPNTEPKYSYINHTPDMLMWHSLLDSSIHKFDIKLRDHKGQLFGLNSLPDFQMTLMFDTVQEVEYSKDFIEAYNKMGYKIGHLFFIFYEYIIQTKWRPFRKGWYRVNR